MNPSTRGRIFAAFLAILLVIGTAALASPAEEGEFLTLLNQARSAEGLAPLAVHNDLVAGARAHTSLMVARGEIFHSTSAELGGVTTGWQVLGENVGVGPNPSVLHTAFMNSPSHRANVLGDFNYVGIGAETAPDGKLYVTFMFMKKAVATTTTTAPPTTTTTAPPLPAPVTATTTTTLPPAPVAVPSVAPAPAPVPVTAATTESTPALPGDAGTSGVDGKTMRDLLDPVGSCSYHQQYQRLCIN